MASSRADLESLDPLVAARAASEGLESQVERDPLEFAPPMNPVMVQWLELMFPDKYPDVVNNTEKAMAFDAGQVEVVRFLRKVLDFQNERGLSREDSSTRVNL